MNILRSQKILIHDGLWAEFLVSSLEHHESALDLNVVPYAPKHATNRISFKTCLQGHTKKDSDAWKMMAKMVDGSFHVMLRNFHINSI